MAVHAWSELTSFSFEQTYGTGDGIIPALLHGRSVGQHVKGTVLVPNAIRFAAGSTKTRTPLNIQSRGKEVERFPLKENQIFINIYSTSSLSHGKDSARFAQPATRAKQVRCDALDRSIDRSMERSTCSGINRPPWAGGGLMLYSFVPSRIGRFCHLGTAFQPNHKFVIDETGKLKLTLYYTYCTIWLFVYLFVACTILSGTWWLGSSPSSAKRGLGMILGIFTLLNNSVRKSILFSLSEDEPKFTRSGISPPRLVQV